MKRISNFLNSTPTAALLLLAASCSTPVYTGPLPKLPKHWPSQRRTGLAHESKGREEMSKLWDRALTQSPALPQDRRSLRKVMYAKHLWDEPRWLSPTLAIASGGSGISLYGLKNGEWKCLRYYWSVEEISCEFPGPREPWLTGSAAGFVIVP